MSAKGPSILATSSAAAARGPEAANREELLMNAHPCTDLAEQERRAWKVGEPHHSESLPILMSAGSPRRLPC